MRENSLYGILQLVLIKYSRGFRDETAKIVFYRGKKEEFQYFINLFFTNCKLVFQQL